MNTRFPDGFLWGAATSSHQVEGDQNNDWTAWEQRPGRIHDGTTSGRALEWWSGRAEEDLARARALGMNAIRMSLEWSRLEPMPDRFEASAFDRYQEILARAAELGLTVVLGLNHFTLPRWLAERGGWLAREAVDRFARYADRCARRLGDHVPYWATLNEPSVLGFLGYAGREWAPGSGDLRAGLRAIRAQLHAHAAAYHAIHDVRAEARVGLVINMPQLIAARPLWLPDVLVATAQDWAFNGVVVHGLAHGRLRFPLALREERAPLLARSLDFLGLNYYGRYRVAFDATRAGELFGRRLSDRTIHTEHNDWGEVAPDGLTSQLVRLSRALPRVPLMVTENGIYDASDARRGPYLREHVRAIAAAIERGADVRGYFVWTLVDNFEWAEGWSTPFGLFALDRASQRRTARPSAEVFARICRANGIDREEPAADADRPRS
jgi:beta-glucosidase